MWMLMLVCRVAERGDGAANFMQECKLLTESDDELCVLC